MKILFVQRDPFEKLGISILSALLKQKGHSCDLLIDSLEKNLIQKALAMDADLIAFSITTNEYSWLNDVGKKIRAGFKKLIICGGSHPTFYPDLIQEDYLDAICVGEGEGAIVDFMDAVVTGGDITLIQNMIVKKDGKIYRNEVRPLIEDLASPPFPDRSLYDKYSFFKHQKNVVFITGRGCPYQCSFCFNKRYNEIYKGKGNVIRKIKPSVMIEQIKTLTTEKPRIKSILFGDDTFILSKDWLGEFLEKYKMKIQIPFSCTGRINLITDDIVRKLKDACCFSIRIGLESGDEYLRNTVLKKHISNEQIINAMNIIKKYRLRLVTFNMLGIPGETLYSAFKTFELNKQIKTTYAGCSLLNPYPGTEILDYAVQNNYIAKDYNCKKLGESYFLNTPLSLDNKREICNFQKIFALGVYLRLPNFFVKFLIKLPCSRLYEFIFKVTYAIGLTRADKRDLLQIIKSRHIFAKYFQKTNKKEP